MRGFTRGGEDTPASALAAAGLRREKIDIRHFRAHKGVSSGIELILLGGESRENLIAVAHSANDRLSAASVQAVEAEFSRSDAVVTQLEIPMSAVKEVAKLAHEARKPFILTGEQDPERAGEKLVQTGCRNAVITLGPKGAMLVNASASLAFPPRRSSRSTRSAPEIASPAGSPPESPKASACRTPLPDQRRSSHRGRKAQRCALKSTKARLS